MCVVAIGNGDNLGQVGEELDYFPVNDWEVAHVEIPAHEGRNGG